MKVQRVAIKENTYRYILLDDDYTVIDSVRRYLKYLDNTGKSPNTIKNYAYHLKLYFEYLKDVGLEYDKINSCKDKGAIDILSEFITWLQNPLYLKGKITCMTSPEKMRSAKTVNLIIGAVLSFYDYLARNKEFEGIDAYKEERKNPLFKSFLYELVDKQKVIRANIFHLKETNKELQLITRKEFEALKENCNSIRDKLLLSIMFEGGLRLGETIGLHIADIEPWDNKINIVPRDGLENGVRVKNVAKGYVYVPPYVMRLFSDYITEEYGNIDSNYIFVNLHGKNKGGPMKPITVQKLFERLSKKVGKKVHPHMCRHGHATELLESGWSIIDIKDNMRHRQIQTTTMYIHPSDSYKIIKYKEFQEKLRKRNSEDDR